MTAKAFALSGALAVAALLSACNLGGTKFSCQKRPGDWGLFKQQPDGPELIACFGGLADPVDDERLCKLVLNSGELGAGNFFCAAFP